MRSSLRTSSVTAALLLVVAGACGSDASVESGDAGSLTSAPTTTSAVTTVETTTTVVETTTTEATTTTAAETTTTAAETTTTAALDCVSPSLLPPMVVAEADGYDTVGTHEGLGAPDNRSVAYITAGGAVAAQAGEGDDSVVEYRIGPAGGVGPSGTIEHALLHDLVVTPTGPAVLYGEIYQGDSEPLAYLNLLEIGTGNVTRITESQAVEYFVYRAAAAGGVVVTSAYSDLTENISTWALDGSGQLERYSPVLSENYGLPPFYGPAVPSPDGTRLAWLEGPDIVGAASERSGDWQLYIADAVTGEVELQLFLGDAEEDFTWFDWDGEWAVLSRGQGEPALAIHTTEPEEALLDVCGESGGYLTGIVTFVVD